MTEKEGTILSIEKKKKYGSIVFDGNTTGAQLAIRLWLLNVSVKCLHFRFEFAEGQNTKIHAKYQNSFQAQNAKVSAVSTPILTAKAAFFSIFRALSEKSVEND